MRLFMMEKNDHGVETIFEIPYQDTPLFDVLDYVTFYTDDKRIIKLEGTILGVNNEKNVDGDMKINHKIDYVIIAEDTREYLVEETLVIDHV